jgi:hypothetical protein
MNILGLRIVTRKEYNKIESEATTKAIHALVELLSKKDRIFIGPTTLVGSNQLITNCAFIASDGDTVCLTIEPEEKKL